MRPLDWIVLVVTLLSIIVYGMWKGRGTRSVQGYHLADRQMKWYVVAFSIMATQASAITFTSTPGLAYIDGMRFVQFYFGLPLAMVILSITAVPIFHKLGVYTAYEYLERRFDLKTRTLTSIIFLLQRGLAVGITIYAPSLVLSVMLGWDMRITSTVIGGGIIAYTVTGGVKSVSWTHFQQMLIILSGMLLALFVIVISLPSDISFTDALYVAGGLGHLKAVDFTFDLNERYNFWSGLIGGMFVALAYFGTDQSQVQRYLTGQSVAQSRIGLLFNGMAKVPMQFVILFIGAMVFVFFQFTRPPIFFNPVVLEQLRTSEHAERFAELERNYELAGKEKEEWLQEYLSAKKAGDAERIETAKASMLESHQYAESIRSEAMTLIRESRLDANDTNYVFLYFVMNYLPLGLVGLIFACIFAASMSSTSGELSALATCSVVDIYQRHIRKEADEKHYMLISRIAMTAWGVYAIVFAQYATQLGALVEAVNILGSLFYGTLLGIFLLAFYVKHVGGTATFIAALVGEVVVLFCFAFTEIAWLWYNVIGCAVVVGVALLLTLFLPSTQNLTKPADNG
ncbi:MAG TPA: sodium:solute symporter [Bacteroidota bacterium]|nr:sodium:solute symporter [Bacteroidota bacterium]